MPDLAPHTDLLSAALGRARVLGCDAPNVWAASLHRVGDQRDGLAILLWIGFRISNLQQGLHGLTALARGPSAANLP